MDEKWKFQKSGVYKKEKNPNWRGGKDVPCAYCGKLIYRTPYQLKKHKEHFCSPECHDDFRRKPEDENRLRASEMKGYKHPRWNGVVKYCKICQKELVGRDQRKRGYCSDECAAQSDSIAKVRRKEDHPSWKGGNVTLECWQCGKEFLTQPGKADQAHYCSNECRFIGKRNRVTLSCEHCGKEFVAAAQRIRDCNPRFCSIGCYRSFMGKTTLESRVAVALDSLGLKYVDEYQPKGTRRRWSFDFYLPDFALFIEADGEFWHHSEWAKSKGTDRRDRAKDKWVKDNGSKIIRIRESEVEGVDLPSIIRLRFQELGLTI